MTLGPDTPPRNGLLRRRTPRQLPTLPTGEPVLHRWFVLAMLALAPVAIGVTVWAFLSIPDGQVAPEARRPAGDGQVTIDRGAADLPVTLEEEAGPTCGDGVTLIGDSGARAAARRALGATCQLLDAADVDGVARRGLEEWTASGGLLRLAAFELSGVESSARVEQGRIVIELNAKFAFEDATRAAPALVHQLALIADEHWPGDTVGARSELVATNVQARACQRLSFAGAPPRGCRDVEELLALDDPLAALVAAGFPER